MQAIDGEEPAATSVSRLDARFRRPLMSFFLRRIKAKADAEDLTQETLLRILARKSSEKLEDMDSYIFTVASNLLVDYQRRVTRFASGSRVPIDEATAGELEYQLREELTPERTLLASNSLQEALAVLSELHPLTRDIYILFRLENMKQKDIAALYGIGQSTVEKHVMRAVLLLTARLSVGRLP